MVNVQCALCNERMKYEHVEMAWLGGYVYPILGNLKENVSVVNISTMIICLELRYTSTVFIIIV